MSHPIDHAWFVSARADPLLDDGIRRQRVYPSIPPAGRGPLHHDSMPNRICVYLGGNWVASDVTSTRHRLWAVRWRTTASAWSTAAPAWG